MSASRTTYFAASRNIEMATSKASRKSTTVIGWSITKIFADVAHAITREKQLKGWRREKKIHLIESTNPRWQDLAENWGREMAFANQSLAEKG